MSHSSLAVVLGVWCLSASGEHVGERCRHVDVGLLWLATASNADRRQHTTQRQVQAKRARCTNKTCSYHISNEMRGARNPKFCFALSHTKQTNRMNHVE